MTAVAATKDFCYRALMVRIPIRINFPDDLNHSACQEYFISWSGQAPYCMNLLLNKLNRFLGSVLILLTCTVSVPLSILTFQTHGGPWGFGVIGLPVLLPLTAYSLFGLAPWFKKEATQRRIFLAAHVITIVTGVSSIFIFPVYPLGVAVIPLALAVLGFVDKRHLLYYLFLMIVLAIVANALLLHWEIEFGRTLPLFQLFQSPEIIPD